MRETRLVGLRLVGLLLSLVERIRLGDRHPAIEGPSTPHTALPPPEERDPEERIGPGS